MLGICINVLLDIWSSFRQWKNFENRLRFKIQHHPVFWDTVYTVNIEHCVKIYFTWISCRSAGVQVGQWRFACWYLQNQRNVQLSSCSYFELFFEYWQLDGRWPVIPLLNNSLRKLTKQCSGKWGTEITKCSITSYLTSSATAIVSGRDHTTMYLQQKLMNVILSLDSCLVTYIDLYTDILSCFYCNLYIVISHVLLDWKLKLWMNEKWMKLQLHVHWVSETVNKNAQCILPYKSVTM